jgi:hypothetical protein
MTDPGGSSPRIECCTDQHRVIGALVFGLAVQAGGCGFEPQPRPHTGRDTLSL